MVDRKLHLLVLPFVHVVHLFSKSHVFTSLHVVIQILLLILSLIFENLLLLTFVEALGNMVLMKVQISIKVLEAHISLLMEPLCLCKILFILELRPGLFVEHLVHLVNLSGNIVLLLELLIHYLMCVDVNLVVADIHINHLIDTLHVN